MDLPRNITEDEKLYYLNLFHNIKIGGLSSSRAVSSSGGLAVSPCGLSRWSGCLADMVYELLRTSTDAPLTGTPVWAQEFNSSEELITEFCRECRIVRKGLAGDLKKAMKDGKPIIIEVDSTYLLNGAPNISEQKIRRVDKGIHLDPSIYLMDDEKSEISTVNIKDKEHENGKGDFPAEVKVKCTSASELTTSNR
ncbi:hypothetical protein KSP40_PGU005877 [Platanthera guangdongensis]|uniref:Uncharacterized protein n=1 Tax=Platanthera guangdongensis TaxID=2320717 RepID=A0ABR2MEJ7_9ASPA